MNLNDFVNFSDGVLVAMKDTFFDNFNVKEGMIIVKKDLALKLFHNVKEIVFGEETVYSNISLAETDLIVSYIDTWNRFMVWVKINNNWEKIPVAVNPEYEEFENNIRGVLKLGNEVGTIAWSKPSDAELYTGNSFKIVCASSNGVTNGTRSAYFYLKTEIPGLYAAYEGKHLYVGETVADEIDRFQFYMWMKKDHIIRDAFNGQTLKLTEETEIGTPAVEVISKCLEKEPPLDFFNAV